MNNHTTGHETESIAMLYATDKHPADRGNDESFGHPVHQGFADAIDAEPIIYNIPSLGPLSGTVVECALTGFKWQIPQHDVYLTEHTHTLYSAPLIKRQYPNSNFIFSAFDHRAYGLNAYNFESSSVKSYIRKLDRHADLAVLRKILNNYVDGVITNSNFIGEVIQSITKSIPIGVAEPYILPDVYDDLAGVEPNLDSKTAVTIGTSLEYKGFDLLVDAWPTVRDEHPDARLNIVGPGHPDSYELTDGVNVLGFVPEVSEPLEDASLYVHPARAEAFGVTVLEAMRAGVPPIVTETTGARSAIRRIDETFVTKPSSSELANRISAYFSTTKEERLHWSQAAKQISTRFNKAERTQAFKNEFESLLSRTL